jgi:ABC-type lipoprotein release transport system permease subunit
MKLFSIQSPMLKNYFKIAFRNLWKNRLFSAINILGLSFATGASLLLILTAMKHFSYDRFHKNAPRIYRAYFEAHRARGLEYTTTMPVPLQAVVTEEVAAAEHAIRWRSGPATVEIAGERYRSGLQYTDQGFFEAFSFDLIKGAPSQVLDTPDGVILSEKTARRFYGTVEGVVGKTIKVLRGNEPLSLQVTGIVEDEPEGSSIQYEMITRYENAEEYADNRTRWDNYNHSLFMLLKENVKKAEAEGQLATLVPKYFAGDLEQITNNGGKAPDGGPVYRIKLQPLKDIHFDRTISKDGISKSFPVGLLLGAFFILGIACINFVNLTLGTSIKRAHEVGVRKVLGANRRQLIYQFWGEALVLSSIALALGFILAKLILPEFNLLFRANIELYQPRLFLALALLLAGIGLFGGGYPALALSRFQAASVLKGNTELQRPGRLRNLLVLVQFVISVVLISCTLIVGQQLDYLRNKALGFNEEEVLSIPLSPGMDGHQLIAQMQNELAPYPSVKQICGAYNNFGRGRDGSMYTSVISFLQDEQELYAHLQIATTGFLETLEIPLSEGRTFTNEISSDTADAVLINERFAQQLGGEGPYVGKVLQMDPARKIVGVVKNFHFQSLENPIEPMVIIPSRAGGDFPLNYLFIRIRPDQLTQTMKTIETVWKDIHPKATFQASFLNENTNRLYLTEKTMGQLFMSASVLAIILSCMGLFGIAILSIAQRTKEISIRKVLGASVSSIVKLLSIDFLRIVAIAILLATPLAWWVMHNWLGNYANRIDISWSTFLLAGFMAIAIAFLTLGFHSVKAATANPANTLRSE